MYGLLLFFNFLSKEGFPDDSGDRKTLGHKSLTQCLYGLWFLYVLCTENERFFHFLAFRPYCLDWKTLGHKSTAERHYQPCDLFAPCGAACPVPQQWLVQVRVVEEADQEVAANVR